MLKEIKKIDKMSHNKKMKIDMKKEERTKLMSFFTSNLSGRVRNFELPATKALMPLYESIVNSIYAIDERQQKENTLNGRIMVHIVREPQQYIQTDGIDGSINDITGFIIIDNGIGFNDANMKSFLQLDSTYRIEKGGKGVGRFTWLKAFRKAKIESCFENGNQWVKRSFDFMLHQDEINDSLIKIDELKDNKTVVTLEDCLSPYKDKLPKGGDNVATKIMQHCFIYLMSPTCPEIIVVDDINQQTYNINQMFRNSIQEESNLIEFEIKNEKFFLRHAKIMDSSFDASKLYLYANDRMVQEINIEKYIVDLDKNLFLENGYYYAGVLSGEFLDKNVGTNRTSFMIPNIAENDLEIGMNDIILKTSEEIKVYLSEYLKEVKKKKKERIAKYIKTTAPQYRHLLNYMEEDIESIKPSLSEIKLDDELHKIKRKFEKQLKEENEKILKTLEVGAVNLDSYQEKFANQFAKISEANKSSLAEYVAHRKVVLELLKKGIRSNDFGKYSKEAFIHNLIYPMRRTSEEIEYQAHNLWLIDEKLAYCDYISSDVPFNNDSKEGRPDVLLLDSPVAVSDEENTGREYGTIIIFELKRPMRDDYTSSDNPIDQMMDYAEKLKENTVKDKYGRTIKTSDNTQLYLYAVCDITDTLIKIARKYNFCETPDKLGMYYYNNVINAYIEILSYDKVIDDTTKRNEILFDKLGI